MSVADLKKILLTDVIDIPLPPTLLMDVKDAPSALMTAYKTARDNIASKNPSTSDDMIFAWNGSVDTLVVNDIATNTATVNVSNTPAANDKLYHVKPISAVMTKMAVGIPANDRAISADKERSADLKDFKNSKSGQDMMAKYGLTPRPKNPFDPK